MLRRSGAAILTEYGTLSGYPRRMAHLNHDEFSIHWGQIRHIARRLGFRKVELKDLQSFLPFKTQEMMFSGDTEVLKRVLALRGVALENAAYTRREVESLVRRKGAMPLKGLQYAPLKDGLHFGSPVAIFKALTLVGPRGS